MSDDNFCGLNTFGIEKFGREEAPGTNPVDLNNFAGQGRIRSAGDLILVECVGNVVSLIKIEIEKDAVFEQRFRCSVFCSRQCFSRHVVSEIKRLPVGINQRQLLHRGVLRIGV